VLNGAGDLLLFRTDSSNLVAGDTNGVSDIFLRDLDTGVTSRVSIGPRGVQSDGPAQWPDMSDDGRYIVYRANASNLDPRCTATYGQVYRLERRTGAVECVSLHGGAGGNHNSEMPQVSDDGNVVTYYTSATDLDPSCPAAPDHQQVMQHNRATGSTTCLSIDADGQPANDAALFPEITPDGRIVVFLSRASNLDPACDTGDLHVYRYDVVGDEMTCISVAPDGVDADGQAFGHSRLSADGRTVLFYSTSTNLVAGDTNAQGDVFVRDLVFGLTTRVSNASTQADGPSFGPDLSADGRFVVYESDATNLVVNDRNGRRDVFRKDNLTGELTRASLTWRGEDIDSASVDPAISGNGRVVVFVSPSSRVVPGDTNGVQDVFAFDSLTRTTTRVSVGAAAVEAKLESRAPDVSGDGRYIVFESDATNLDPDCTQPVTAVYRHDRASGATACFASAAGSIVATAPSISSDGALVALRTQVPATGHPCSGRVPAGANVIARWQPDTGTTTCLPEGQHPAIAANGAHIAFVSPSTTLDSACTNGVEHIFVWSAGTGRITCVSRALDGAPGDAGSTVPSVSGDGRWVAFRSGAANLVANDANGADDVFVKDLATGQVTRSSTDADLREADGASDAPAVSDTGAYVAFETDASNLVYGDTAGHRDVVMRAAHDPVVDAVVPNALPRGATTNVTITGLGFRSDSTLHFGAGVTLGPVSYVAPTELRVDVTVAPNAEAGVRTISVANLGAAWNPASGATATCNCLTIT
jgi:Tol biopolymer transport system component